MNKKIRTIKVKEQSAMDTLADWIILITGALFFITLGILIGIVLPDLPRIWQSWF